MSTRRGWSIIAVNVIVVVAAVSACRTQEDSVEQTTSSTPTATESTVTETEDEPPTIEVTRIVVETEVVEVTPESEPTQAPARELVICVGDEPQSLYPYSAARVSPSTTHLLQAIYESMYTTLSYDYQARGVEKLPSLADGDALIRDVLVQEGDRVYDAISGIVTLREGFTLRNSDGDDVEFDGTPIMMPQMIVNFELKPLIWSDGTPVTAGDSVYSFELAADTQTPIPKQAVDLTASYEATGDLSLEWKGIPGYLDPSYFTNIWTPYPRHQWGRFTAAELLLVDDAVREPLSHGPFVVDEWVTGDYITLQKNENYYLADQGLPKVDVIQFKFVPSESQLMAQLLSGECDIGTQDGISVSDAPMLIDAEKNGLLVPYFQAGTVFEHIDFGINPVETYANTQPDWFEDVRVRQAIVMCTDRQRMVEELLFGRAEVLNAYVPAIHPLYPEDLVDWPYDVAAANALLEEAGYRDLDEDGIRQDVVSGTPLNLTLLGATGNELSEQVVTIFAENLAQCGIEVELSLVNADTYFADGPDGPLFGRQFDMAAFPWLISIEPNCALYLSSRIPGPDNNWDRNFNNETGFSDTQFDAACELALDSLPGTAGYEESHREALSIWSEQVPAIPLFMRLKVAATRPEVRNFVIDPTQISELWNIYELDVNG